MALKAILAILLIHILSVAGNEYISFRENHGSQDKHWTKLGSSFKSGFEIGFAFSSVSILTIFVSYCVPWTRLNKRKRNKVMMKSPLMASLIARQDNKRKEANMQISKFEKLIRRVSFEAIKKATASFDRDNVIGVGKTGTTYKAALPYDCFTAVKRLHNNSHSENRFMSELMMLSRFRHINLVPLLGICTESRERILVYKYMPNGNLYDWLHNLRPVKGETKILDWHIRVKITLGIARGLSWLHSYNAFQIAHLKISSSCILLDKYFEPKLSNFGEAMLISCTDNSSVNSKFWETAFVKEDVRGFGVVLLELITGVDFSNMTDSSNSILNERIDHLLSSSNSYSVIDKSLIGQGFDAEIFQMLKVACNCVDSIPDRRPTMLQVYEDIKAIRERCEQVNDSDMLMQPEVLPVPSENSTVEIEIAES
ncbi:unnamed protein product [Dovyalis caffra]|uniref:Protein kinase domain-containing protein n=1 Tax=Dovyalis caffra TaxID=77055 RepID=A0AAV1QTQ3_9ROSI|nr:unnamed protein product [Dovyalis caffra]